MSNQGSEFEQVVELVFQNVQYLLTVSLAPGDTLCVEAEHKTDGSRWRGDFTARYIEDITQKTGNFKKFAVFVKMLRSAILQESDSVFVDLLTYQDLEMLKNRLVVQSFHAKHVISFVWCCQSSLYVLREEICKCPAMSRTEKVRDIGSQSLRSATNNKRYLILTYTGEFDRVHYPLPLLHEDNPEPEALKRTIRRLRDELEDVKGTLQKKIEQTRHEFLDDEASVRSSDTESAELRKLREENSRLTAQLSCMEDSYRMFGLSTHVDRREVDEDRKKLQKELALTQKKCDLLFSKIDAKKDMKKETETLRARLDQLQDDLRSERSVHRKAVARLARDNATLTQEVRSLRDAEKRLRVKMRESESELDILKRRLKVQGSRDLPPSRTRPRETISVPSTRLPGGVSNGSRRPSPLSTRANTPTGSRRTPLGSRPSSCPSFGRASRNHYSDASRRGRSPREARQIHTVQSQPSSARSTDPYAREISRSAGRARPLVAGSSRRDHETLSVSNKATSPLETSKSGSRSRASRESQRYARENVSLSPERNWRRNVGSQALRGLMSSKVTGPASTPNGLTSDDERELVVGHVGSRASSPSTVLMDVKAKLHKYARREGIEMSDVESRSTTSGSLKDFNVESSSMNKLGRYDVIIERELDDEKDDMDVMDIDSRLHALQNFLKTAKASVK